MERNQLKCHFSSPPADARNHRQGGLAPANFSSISETTHDQEILESDSESVSSSACPRDLTYFSGNGMVRLLEGDRTYNILKDRFISGMGLLGRHTTVVAVHKNLFSSALAQARLQSFWIFAEAAKKKYGGNKANIKAAWYGTSRNGVCTIISHGFGLCEKPENDQTYGSGLYLSHENSSVDSAMSSILDENGLRHVLVCHVILGNMEEVHPGSKQFHPSSVEFDSGVDNLLFPKKYIVWSAHINTHVLPGYVISFKAPPCLKGFQGIQEPVLRPTSPWMPFPALISVLSRFLPPSAISSIKKYDGDYRAKKITRQHLIRKVRQLAGDKLLSAVIKACRGKQLKDTPFSLPSVNPK